MKDIVNTLVGLGITIGLSDRETFAKQVSSIIKEYQKNPETSEKWTNAVMAYLEQKRDNINMQSAISTAMAGGAIADPEKIEELTKAIKELTKELQHAKDKV